MGVEWVWLGIVLGSLPLVGWVLWWWNELWYAVPLKARGGIKLPPGDMGLPFLGETITFIWYFKFLRRPDEFINAKRRKYGDGAGIFKTHLFGSPCIIAYTPSVNKFVYQSQSNFILEWLAVELVGSTSVAAVHGKSHARLRSYITNAVNHPDALHRIALLVQPRIVATLQSWAHKGQIIARLETKKVMFENVGKLFEFGAWPSPT